MYSNRYEVGVVRQEVGVVMNHMMSRDFDYTICFHLTQVFQDGCQTTIVPTQYVPPPQQYVVQQPLLQVWVCVEFTTSRCPPPPFYHLFYPLSSSLPPPSFTLLSSLPLFSLFPSFSSPLLSLLSPLSSLLSFLSSLLSSLSSLLSVQQPPPQTDVHHSALLQYHTTQPQQPNQPVPLIPTQKPITQGVLPPQQLVHGATAATPTQLLPGSTGTGLGAQLPPPSLLTLPHQQQLYSTNQQVGRGEEFKGLTYYGIKRVN